MTGERETEDEDLMPMSPEDMATAIDTELKSQDSPHVRVTYAGEVPDFDTPAAKFESIWESSKRSKRKDRLINKHVTLALIEYMQALLTIDTSRKVDDEVHACIHVWFEGFDWLSAVIDIESLFKTYVYRESHDAEEFDEYIASFQRIIKHIEETKAERLAWLAELRQRAPSA